MHMAVVAITLEVSVFVYIFFPVNLLPSPMASCKALGMLAVGDGNHTFNETFNHLD